MRSPNMERFRNQLAAVAVTVGVVVPATAYVVDHTQVHDPTDMLPAVVTFMCTHNDKTTVFTDHIDNPTRSNADRAEMWQWRDRHHPSECIRV